MATIFTKIINGDIPCHKIAENDKFFAFLDISPVAVGHTLVIPKQETDYLFDIDDAQLAEMIVFAKTVARAIEASVPCQRIGISVMGLEVPHAHIHLIPLDKSGLMDFTHKITQTQEQLAQTASSVRSKL
ncbi:MAG: purine nucleoside phosphoramidase [Bacteroidota bacterium]|jgi:histidine triad (HIT) family protein